MFHFAESVRNRCIALLQPAHSLVRDRRGELPQLELIFFRVSSYQGEITNRGPRTRRARARSHPVWRKNLCGPAVEVFQ